MVIGLFFIYLFFQSLITRKFHPDQNIHKLATKFYQHAHNSNA
jgi:hypothetical protein